MNYENMKNKNLEQLKKYFSSFCSKNIDDLKNIFSDDVELKDWNNEFFGKEQVLEEVKSIFNSFDSIQLEIIDIYNSDNKFACQIEISFDSKEPLRVIDLIEFDNTGNIKNLIAYKR